MIRKLSRGAAGQQYAIVVGLVAVIAIASVVKMGGSVQSVFSKVSNTTNSVAGAPPIVVAPPPNPGDLVLQSGSGSGYTINGAAQSPTACVDFVIGNTGEITRSITAAGITAGGTNFETLGCTNSCTGTIGAGGSCSIGVRMKATADGSPTGTLQVTDAQGGSVTVPLSGTALGFTFPSWAINDYGVVSGVFDGSVFIYHSTDINTIFIKSSIRTNCPPGYTRTQINDGYDTRIRTGLSQTNCLSDTTGNPYTNSSVGAYAILPYTNNASCGTVTGKTSGGCAWGSGGATPTVGNCGSLNTPTTSVSTARNKSYLVEVIACKQ